LFGVPLGLVNTATNAVIAHIETPLLAATTIEKSPYCFVTSEVLKAVKTAILLF
jgi:hypothetical protein